MAQRAAIRGSSTEVCTNLRDDSEMKYWSEMLGIAPDVLERAVRAVGAESTTIHEYLKQRRSAA